MAYFAVSYQLEKGDDYQPLWDAFEALGAHKVMRSFYFVDLDTTAQNLRDHLRQFIDDNDHLAVVPFSQRPYKHRCYKGTQDWIDERFG